MGGFNDGGSIYFLTGYRCDITFCIELLFQFFMHIINITILVVHFGKCMSISELISKSFFVPKKIISTLSTYLNTSYCIGLYISLCPNTAC